MTPPAALLNQHATGSVDNLERPSKRVKTASAQVKDEIEEAHQGSTVRRHPLGVRPSGNALTSAVSAKDATGLFARLPDELLMQMLESFDAPTLLRLGASCRALHAFTRAEDLWRALFVE